MEAYLNRKSGKGSRYNYDLEPLIKKFSFYDFVANVKKDEDFGGFLVITNKQYVIGYTAGFGAGTHMAAFARVMMDMNDPNKGQIKYDRDAIKLNSECTRNYITARILYESHGYDQYGIPQFLGYINFELSSFGGKITPSQFEVFKQFYNDYNEDINYVTKKYNFFVAINYKDEEGKTQRRTSQNLDELYEYLEKNIDETKVILEDSVIIGKCPPSKKR